MRTLRHGSYLGSNPVHFTFDGRTVEGVEGDSAASALLANNITLLGRSVKYRRPRGVFTAGIEEPNALLTVGALPYVIPNVPATQLRIEPSLHARSQNRWPSLRWNLSSVLQLGKNCLSAGFYYKTFMWPGWRTYEGLIRRLAGLGAAPAGSKLPDADIQHLDADVLVVGAGPAGLSAALSVARAHGRVVLCERELRCGGELDFETAQIAGHPALEWVDSALCELRASGAQVLTGTAVVGGSRELVMAHRVPNPGHAGTAYRIHARRVVAATGVIEHPIAFVNNDLPGVMLVSAADRYLARYGVRVGKAPVLFGNHDRLYSTAARLLEGGVAVRAIVDTRSEHAAQSSQRARENLRRGGVDCLIEHVVVAAHCGFRVRGVTVAPRAAPSETQRILCDALLVSGGWTPCPYAALLGGEMCGAAAGELEIQGVLRSGSQAGARAMGASGDIGVDALGDGDPHVEPFWRSPARREDEKSQFVDLQNDVTVADLRQALEEGFNNIEHVKRYTTLGVGTDQGRTSAPLGAAIVAELSQLPTIAPQRSMARPPFQPVTLKTLCGRRVGMALRPERHTALHAWHEAHGGILEANGWWMRPRFYKADGLTAFDAGLVEAARVRRIGGIFDGSTLGKIEVSGPDAAVLLDRLYLTTIGTLRPGRARYSVCLREDGMVLDDGLVLRLADDRFVATVSSGHAGAVLSHFEHWLAREPRVRAALTDVTEAWSVIVVAGPDSRNKLFGVLGAEWRESLAALRHMDFSRAAWESHELIVLRASFSGELAFELHCRPGIALPLWQRLVDAGLEPYGLEALDILRVEKGYLTSAEINGQTTPMDLGIKIPTDGGVHYVGQNLLARPAFSESQRPCLIGLRAADGRSGFRAGAQLTTSTGRTRSLGHVTSAVFSPALSQWIGLALLSREAAREGVELLARDPLRDCDTRVTVAPTAQWDPKGERMRA